MRPTSSRPRAPWLFIPFGMLRTRPRSERVFGLRRPWTLLAGVNSVFFVLALFGAAIEDARGHWSPWLWLAWGGLAAVWLCLWLTSLWAEGAVPPYPEAEPLAMRRAAVGVLGVGTAFVLGLQLWIAAVVLRAPHPVNVGIVVTLVLPILVFAEVLRVGAVMFDDPDTE